MRARSFGRASLGQGPDLWEFHCYSTTPSAIELTDIRSAQPENSFHARCLLGRFALLKRRPGCDILGGKDNFSFVNCVPQWSNGAEPAWGFEICIPAIFSRDFVQMIKCSLFSHCPLAREHSEGCRAIERKMRNNIILVLNKFFGRRHGRFRYLEAI